MKKVYLDNAATTPVFEEVITEMSTSMRTIYGNPSSTHQYGRTAKSAIENARKSIAKCLGISSSELIFTSGGTEANNLILKNAVDNLGVTRIISSKTEHHAVLNTLEELKQSANVQIAYVAFDEVGAIDLVHLRKLLADTGQKTLVSLMFVNNEIGTILDAEKIGGICKEYQALFHSDAVQAVGHFDLNLSELEIDFISASAHKFHGPKGVGFAYFRKGLGVKPMLFGGAQEKGARAGTEAVHAILGMAKALEICSGSLVADIAQIKAIKAYCIELIEKELPAVSFNGGSDDLKKATVTVLNIRLPLDLPFILFNLDLKGIAVSGGSACQSGANGGSHVLQAILPTEETLKTSIRLSFSTLTTKEDIAYTIEVLKDLLAEK